MKAIVYITYVNSTPYSPRIITFRFTDCKLVKDKTYKFDSVCHEEKNKASLAKKLEVLSSWYLVNDNVILIPAKDENHFFIKVEKYIATSSLSPKIVTRTLFFSKEDFNAIDNAILEIIQK